MAFNSFYRSCAWRLLVGLLVVGAVESLTGCERAAPSSYTAEVDEAGFRRGKELLRQGRDQDALASFLKVIEKRGDEAPESHLELGLLYQEKIKDPIAAIYHYRKFTTLRPNSPQYDLVRQRIDAATRDFARALPAQPMENQFRRNDLLDVVERLQQENAELKNALTTSRVNERQVGTVGTVGNLGTAPTLASTPAPTTKMETWAGPALITRAPLEDEPAARPLAPPTRPDAIAAGERLHVVVRGDTLYSLAQRYYNNRSRWRDIYEANRGRMRSENDLQLGMQLIIPQ